MTTNDDKVIGLINKSNKRIMVRKLKNTLLKKFEFNFNCVGAGISRKVISDPDSEEIVVIYWKKEPDEESKNMVKFESRFFCIDVKHEIVGEITQQSI